VPAPRLPDAGGPPRPAGEQTVHTADGPVAAAVHDRAALLAGHELAGPAIVTEYSATTWVPTGWSASVLGDGSLLCRTVFADLRKKSLAQ
jgi:N-methylhydantoinase A